VSWRARRVFCAVYDLGGNATLDDDIYAEAEGHLAWFRANLTIPAHFSRSSATGAWRQECPAGRSWFKDSVRDVIGRFKALSNVLPQHGYPIDPLRSERVGTVVYDDDNQLVAEPFSDTPVRGDAACVRMGLARRAALGSSWLQN